MKEAFQNATYSNHNIIYPRNIQVPTKTLMDTGMVKTDDKNTAIAENKGLHRKQPTNRHNTVEHSFYFKWLKYENTLSHACKIFLLHDMLRHWLLYNSSNTCLRFLT